jgi:hypothetical protein
MNWLESLEIWDWLGGASRCINETLAGVDGMLREADETYRPLERAADALYRALLFLVYKVTGEPPAEKAKKTE